MNKMKKILVFSLAALLLVAVGVGGTMAWLTAKTTVVTNTFAPETIEIELKEHKLSDDGINLLEKTAENEVTSNEGYKLMPGQSLEKDPFVRVTKGKCYIFVEVVPSTAPKAEDYLTWTNKSGWGLVKDVTGPNGGVVYGHTATDGNMKAVTAEDNEIYFLDKFGVKGTVTSEMMAVDNIDDLSLSFYAYALQAEVLQTNTPEALWKTYVDNAATTSGT